MTLAVGRVIDLLGPDEIAALLQHDPQIESIVGIDRLDGRRVDAAGSAPEAAKHALG